MFSPPLLRDRHRAVLAAAATVFASLSLARTPLDEAALLRAKLIANAGALSSLHVESELRLEPLDAMGATTTAPSQTSRESVTWDKAGKKLKWRSLTHAPQAYAVDGKAMQLAVVRGDGATTFSAELTTERATVLDNPFPAWLWQPEHLVPASPASARVEGSVLIVSSSATDPVRTLWLARDTGCLLKFMETDATGRLVRAVSCDGWAKHGGVWLPQFVTETITAAKNGLRRTVTFGPVTVNPVLTPGDFQLW